MSTSERLSVFISSTLGEFRDLRDHLSSSLENLGFDPYIFEFHGPARPDSPEVSSLEALSTCDVYIGIFANQLGDLTYKEYQFACRNNKPMFLYVRGATTERSPELAQFIDSELDSSNSKVSYSIFQTATELNEKIAADLHAWLVRQYRELTAASSSGRYAHGEVDSLRLRAGYFQNVTSEILPTGSPSDLLARDVRQWTLALGYTLEDIERSESHFEQIAIIPGRRRTERILIHGVSGEAGLSEFTRIQAAAAGRHFDELWLVANRRISQVARTAAASSSGPRTLCMTFDDLIDETADFSRYFAWIDEEYANQHIEQYYVPRSIRRPDYDDDGLRAGESFYAAKSGGVEVYLDQWMSDPASEHLSILGEFGIGKTWLILHYAKVLLDKYRSAARAGIARPRLPLVVPLRDYAKASTVESLLSDFLFRRYEIGLPGYSAFDCLNRMGKFVLLFDGFDEMAARVDRQRMIDNFWELARVLGPTTKALLTCRTEHFPHGQEGKVLLGAELLQSRKEMPSSDKRFSVLHLPRFTKDDVKSVLLRQCSPEVAAQVMNVPELVDLAKRPIMIGFVLEALPEVRAGKDIDLARVYLYACTRKMRRDIGQERTFTSLSDKLYFLAEVSTTMLETSSLSLNYRQFPATLERLFPWISHIGPGLDNWQYDMMTQSMLIRSEDGNYSPAHRSLAEFFTAYRIGALLGALSEDFVAPAREASHISGSMMAIDQTWSEYYRRDVSEPEATTRPPLASFKTASFDELIENLKPAILSQAVIELLATSCDSERLMSTLELVRGSSSEDVAEVGGLILTVLSTMGTNLGGRDLTGLHVRGADCESLSLEGADLTGANFENCRLRRVNLSRANLSEAQFNGTQFFACEARDAQLDGVEFDSLSVVVRLGHRIESFGTRPTVLDVAARLHRQVMMETTGALVNGSEVTIEFVLNPLDAVWIQRNRGALTVCQDWVEICRTWTGSHYVERFFRSALWQLKTDIGSNAESGWVLRSGNTKLYWPLLEAILDESAGSVEEGCRRVAAEGVEFREAVVGRMVAALAQINVLRAEFVTRGFTPSAPRTIVRLLNLMKQGGPRVDAMGLLVEVGLGIRSPSEVVSEIQ